MSKPIICSSDGGIPGRFASVMCPSLPPALLLFRVIAVDSYYTKQSVLLGLDVGSMQTEAVLLL